MQSLVYAFFNMIIKQSSFPFWHYKEKVQLGNNLSSTMCMMQKIANNYGIC